MATTARTTWLRGAFVLFLIATPCRAIENRSTTSGSEVELDVGEKIRAAGRKMEIALKIIDTHLQFIEEYERPRLEFLRNATYRIIVALKKGPMSGVNEAFVHALRTYQWSKLTVMSLGLRASQKAFEQLFQIATDVGEFYNIRDSLPMMTLDAFNTIDDRLNDLIQTIGTSKDKTERALRNKLIDAQQKVDAFLKVAATGDHADTYDEAVDVCLTIFALYDELNHFGAFSPSRSLIVDLEGTLGSYIDSAHLNRKIQVRVREHVTGRPW